jgi:dolichyldiphosphatase
MPSSHSAIIIYFVTFASLQLSNITTLSPLIKLLYSLMFYVIALLILWSRVELGHHTTSQVLMGMLLGTTLAIFWNNLWVNHWIRSLHELKLDGKLGYNELGIIWNCVNEIMGLRQ